MPIDDYTGQETDDETLAQRRLERYGHAITWTDKTPTGWEWNGKEWVYVGHLT